MIIEETYMGMRIDTFLGDEKYSTWLSEEPLETYMTQEEEEKVIKNIISVLDPDNRLPDDEPEDALTGKKPKIKARPSIR